MSYDAKSALLLGILTKRVSLTEWAHMFRLQDMASSTHPHIELLLLTTHRTQFYGGLKVAATVLMCLGLAVLRDSAYYRWLRGPTLLPVIGLAAVALRMKTLFFSTSSSTNASATPLPPSLLTHILVMISDILSSPAHAPFLILLQDILALFLLLGGIHGVRGARRLQWAAVKANVGDSFFDLIKDFGPVRRKLEEETRKLETTMEHSLRPPGWNGEAGQQGGRKEVAKPALPPKGVPAEELLRQMKSFVGKEEGKWKDGWVSGAVYGGEEEVVALMGEASALYALTNPLHPDLWPSVMKFESEVCGMVCKMVNGGDEGVVGCLTSGGTESIMLAAKAHRDWARAEKGVGGHEGEIVACVSAHAAIHKAADVMGLRLVLVPMDPTTFKVDVKAMEAAITSSTVLLYASAPTFAQGVIDGVSDVSRLGLKYSVGVHVDCCLGGFLLPFARKAGVMDIPPFDFSLPGVTSMSVDTHKYGYAAKGTSVVCYRNQTLRHHQYFCFPSWTGGLYVTPTLAGSRPGALSAACWAALMWIGEEGYVTRARDVLLTARRIAQGVRNGIPGVELQGSGEAMIVCVGGREGVDIYEVGDRMAQRGWNLNALQAPAGLHLCCTLRHVGKEERFLKHLTESAAEVMAEGGKEGGRKGGKEGNSAIYGMAATLPAGPINEMLKVYTDCVLKA